MKSHRECFIRVHSICSLCSSLPNNICSTMCKTGGLWGVYIQKAIKTLTLLIWPEIVCVCAPRPNRERSIIHTVKYRTSWAAFSSIYIFDPCKLCIGIQWQPCVRPHAAAERQDLSAQSRGWSLSFDSRFANHQDIHIACCFKAYRAYYKKNFGSFLFSHKVSKHSIRNAKTSAKPSTKSKYPREIID